MVGVLRRAVGLLEVVAAAGAQGLATRAAAQAVGLPQATVSRLLAACRDLGFVDQEGCRGAWRLGPRLPALARASRHQAVLGALAPPLTVFARRHGCGVVLAARRGARRLTLLGLAPARSASRHDDWEESADLPATAGGRVLLAVAPARQRRALLDAAGLPGPAWPGLLTSRELDGELAAIRREGVAEVGNATLRARACPLTTTWDETLALGLYVPRDSTWAWAAPLRRLARRCQVRLDGLR